MRNGVGKIVSGAPSDLDRAVSLVALAGDRQNRTQGIIDHIVKAGPG
jgi:hypothetical protein